MILMCTECGKTNEKKFIDFYKIGVRLLCEYCFKHCSKLEVELSCKIVQ